MTKIMIHDTHSQVLMQTALLCRCATIPEQKEHENISNRLTSDYFCQIQIGEIFCFNVLEVSHWPILFSLFHHDYVTPF